MQTSQAWERRLATSAGIICFEAGSDTQPVALVHLYELDAEKVTLSTAFTGPMGPKVFFLDRLIDCKRLLGHFNYVAFEEVFYLPFFLNEGLDLSWVPYRVTAAVAHLQTSIGGHFRALLRDPQTDRLLLCDDNHAPQEVDTIPDFFHTRGVLFWALACTAESSEDEHTKDESASFTQSHLGLQASVEAMLPPKLVPATTDPQTGSIAVETEGRMQMVALADEERAPTTFLAEPGPPHSLPLCDDSHNRALAARPSPGGVTGPGSLAMRNHPGGDTSDGPLEGSALHSLLLRLKAADESIERVLADTDAAAAGSR